MIKSHTVAAPRRDRTMLLALACALALTALPASATDVLVDAEIPRDRWTVRDSGEIRVSLDDARTTAGGIPYRVTLAFMSLDDYEAALGIGETRLTLQDLDAVVYFGEEGHDYLLKTKLPASLDELLKLTRGTVCSNVLGRGMVMLAREIPMVVDVRSDPELLRNGPWGDGDNWPCGTSTCQTDVFDDCDGFAILGCSGDPCLNLCRDADCNIDLFPSSCGRMSVPILPDPCVCLITSPPLGG